MKKGFCLILLLVFTTATSTAQNDTKAWHNFNTSNSNLLSNVIQTLEVNHIDGSVWAAYPGSGGDGLGIAKFSNGTWVNYNSTNSGLPNNDIRAIATDHDGNMWFACYNAGLVKFDGTNWTIYNTSNSGIVGDIVVTLKVDQENNLWIGSYADGISKFDGVTWTNYTSANAPFQDFACIDDIVIDDSNNVWVGIACGLGLAKLDVAGNWTTYTTSNSGLAGHSVSSMIKDNAGNLWIGYINGNKISRFDGNTWVTYTPFIKASSSVGYNGFATDAEGNIWCHSGDGLYQFSNGQWSNIIIPALADTTFTAINITADQDGNIWWGSYDGVWTNDMDVCDQFPIDGLVTQVADYLVVSDLNAEYQWKDCLSGQEIPGEDKMEFTPVQSGMYAVDVSKNGCSITSQCFAFTNCNNVLQAIVSKVDNILFVSDENAEYQWIDCATASEIPDSVNQSFMPIVSGSYQVRVSKDNCTLTSVCFDFVNCETTIEALVTQEDDHLVVSEDAAEYQWIDCATSLEIPGAKNKIFTPEVSGEYRVQISKEGCTITSACTAYEQIIAGLPSLQESNLQVFPNPAKHQVSIDLGKQVNTVTISIKAYNGTIVFEGKFTNRKDITFSMEELPSGLYFVFINTGSSFPQVKKLIIE